MATPRFAWGIDIGNRALKAVKLVADGPGVFRVDDFAVIEYETVLSNAGDNRDTLVQNALNQFVSEHSLKGGGTAIGVSGQASFARFIKLPPVEPKKIPEIVRFEAIQQIPFPLEDVEWSYQLFQDPTNPDVEVGIFAMRKELVNQQIQQFADLGVDVHVVQMNPLAVYNAMRFDNRLDGATMIVDLGAENADLIICEGDGIWMRSIPIGGNNFTEALVKAFKVNFQKAEELKRNAATSKYQRQIFQAMRPVFSDLVSEIQRSIGFYASVHRDARITRVIATGGTFRLPTLQKYLQQNLQVPVDRVDTLAAAPPSEPKEAQSFNDNVLSLPAAYGLALQAMDQGTITSSLLPQAIRKDRMWKDKNKWFATAAGLFLAGSVIALGSAYLAGKTVYSQKASIESDPEISRVIKEAKENDQAWAKVESAGTQERALISNVATLTKGRNFWPRLISDIDAAVAATDPQPELLTADPLKVKTIARGDRRQITVHSIESQYRADMSGVANATEAEFRDIAAGGQPPAPAEGAVVAEKQRGFLVTLKFTTPNKGGYEFVDNTIMKGLLAIDAAAGQERGYYIPRARIIEATQGISPGTIQLAEARAGAAFGRTATTVRRTVGSGGGAAAAGPPMGSAAVGGPGNIAAAMQSSMAGLPEHIRANILEGMKNRPGGFATAGLPSAGGAAGRAKTPAGPVTQVVSADAAARDPLTDEPMDQDYAVTVVFAVVLDPPPPPAAEPTASAR